MLKLLLHIKAAKLVLSAINLQVYACFPKNSAERIGSLIIIIPVVSTPIAILKNNVLDYPVYNIISTNI